MYWKPLHFPPSGWRRDRSGKSAQCVKLGSAEKTLSLFMGEGVRSPRIPGEREEGAEGRWKTSSLVVGCGSGENISCRCPSFPQIENSASPPRPATSSRRQRGESCLIVSLLC